jgi:double-stranded RNA-binding protein Staufen
MGVSCAWWCTLLFYYILQISHQYTLVDEQGPAHKKTFFVQLKLGDTEEYAASGPSIKKAQHAAAAEALEKTTFTHPPSKPIKPNHSGQSVISPLPALDIKFLFLMCLVF